MALVPHKPIRPQNVSDESLHFYPAYCYKASPTHFTWVKLTAIGVHQLDYREGYEGQNLYFYKNHPIKFICLAGIIVSREEQFRRTFVVLDDGSGSNIEIVCSKLDPQTPLQIQPLEEGQEATGMVPVAQLYVTSTTKEALDITSLVPGVVAKLKGTIATFRGMRQLHLERYELLHTLSREMQFWEERTQFMVNVLSNPWRLSAEQVERLRIEEAGDGEKKKGKARERERERRRIERKKVEREEKDREKIAKRYEKEEKDREKIAKRYEKEEKVRMKYAERCREISSKLKRYHK